MNRIGTGKAWVREQRRTGGGAAVFAIAGGLVGLLVVVLLSH